MEDTICAVSTAPGAGGLPSSASPDRKQSQSATRYSYRVQQEKACCHRKPIHCVTVVSGVVKSS